jgi:RNA polymerase sigma-70 factor (ECF subfamily)
MSVMQVMANSDPPPGKKTMANSPTGLEAVETPREEFSRLMRENYRELLVYSRAIVSDHHAGQDLAQEAFVSAYRKFATFDRSQDFGAWMRGIVKHKCLDWFRKQKRTPLPDTEMVDIEIDVAAWQQFRESEPAAQNHLSLFSALEDCVSQLPERLRESVRRFYFADRCGEEAATDLGIPSATLRKRLERARTKLHECLTSKL